MSRIRRFPRRLVLAAALALGLAAFGAGATGAFAKHSAGEVYSLTNSPAGNAVKAFDRGGNGSLNPDGTFATGGTGTGGGLGNQDALVLKGDCCSR